MGLFGGSSLSTSSSSNILDFNPIFNIGDGNETALDKTLDQTATTSPRLDDSFGLSASVGVGVGGTGSGGTAQTSRQQQEDYQPITTKSATESNGVSGVNLTYLFVALIGGGALVYYAVKK